MAAGQNKGDRGETRGLLLEGLAESGAEFRGAVVIEQAKELRGEAGGGFAALEGGLEESLAFRDPSGQTAGRGRAQGLAFLFEQGLAMGGILDELMAVIGAAMRSDFGQAVEEADGGGRSDQRQRAAQRWGRDGIIIEVKADAKGLIGVNGAPHVAAEGVSGERQQARFLFLKNLGDGARVVAGPGALMGDLVAPLEGLAVEIRQGGEGAGREKAVTDILNGALDAAFFPPRARTAGPGGEVVVGGKLQEAGVEVDGVAAALQDDTAEVVGFQAPRRSPPVGEGVDMAEEKILQALVEEELKPQGAAVGEGEDEAGQTASGPTDGDLAEVGPVGLSLLSGERAQTQKRFPVRRAQFGHDAAELGDTAGVAARADHLEEASGAQTRILLQGLAQEVEVRVGEAGAEARMRAEAIRLQRAAHGVRMEAEFGHDGADFPMLGVKEMTDAGDLFIGNHA